MRHTERDKNKKTDKEWERDRQRYIYMEFVKTQGCTKMEHIFTKVII